MFAEYGVSINSCPFVMRVSLSFGVSEKALTIGFLVPSVVFWSSGFTKESLALTMILLGTVAILDLIEKRKIWYVLLAVSVFVVAFKIKYYVVVPYLGLFLLVLWQRSGVRKYGQWTMAPFLVVLLTLSVISHPNLHLGRFYEAVTNSNAIIVTKDGSDVSPVFPSLGEGWYWLVLYAPKAFFLGLFRPFVWEADNVLELIQAVERAILSVLTIWGGSILFFQRTRFSFIGYAACVFVVLVAVVVAYSVPNFGSISRYSCMYVPFWITLVVSPILKKYE